MKHFWKRLLAVALAIVMLVGVLPPGALAAELLGNDPAYNREILAALEDVTGSAEEAEA